MTLKTIDLQPDTLISAYLPLVTFLAKKYTKYGLSLEDLVQEGLLGLLEAGKRYDSARDVQFDTYASYWIKKYILNALGKEAKHSFRNSELNEAALPDPNPLSGQEMENSLGLPSAMPDLEQSILRLSFEQRKTIKEIATELHLSPEKVRQIREKALRRLRISKSPSL
jgi:RNA polymerase sigma factor (sigma-70 family)